MFEKKCHGVINMTYYLTIIESCSGSRPGPSCNNTLFVSTTNSICAKICKISVQTWPPIFAKYDSFAP